jgi:hypothetical protein
MSPSAALVAGAPIAAHDEAIAGKLGEREGQAGRRFLERASGNRSAKYSEGKRESASH